MITIQSTTNIVAASGVEATTEQQQGGTTSQATDLVAHGDVSSATHLPAGSGVSISNVVTAASGVSEYTHLINSSPYLTTVAPVEVSDPTLSGSTPIFGIIGTSGTSEWFFDRSQMYFESKHESDPNTERDLSAVEPFMMFSSANIFSYDYVTSTPTTTTIITAKGDEFSDASLASSNAITNGGFEQSLSSWTNYNDTLGRVTTLTNTDYWPWSRLYLPGGVEPTEGSRMLALDLYLADKGALISDNLFAQGLSSEVMGAFSFDVMTGGVGSSNYGLSFDIQFFNGLSKVYEIKYLVDDMNDVSGDAIFDDLELYPVDSVTLTPAPTQDVWQSYTTDLRSDTENASFTFDKIRFIIFAGTTVSNQHNEMVLDDIQLGLNIVPEHLTRTDGAAHIVTTHPTASGGVPFTISGSEDITVEDKSGPIFTLTVPVSGSENVPESTPVAFHVTDAFSSLDTGNVDVWIDGFQVVTASTTVTGTTWPTATRTVISSREIAYEFFRSTVFDSGVTITVSGELTDLAAVSNQTITDYQFQIVGSGALTAAISGSEDGDPPIIDVTAPLDLATQVSPDTAINWSVTDVAAGVDPSTVKLYLNGGLKVNGNFNSPQGGSVSITANAGKGYDYEFQPAGSFSYGQTVSGTVEAYDVASTPNFATTSFEFTITPSETLEITNFFLGSAETTLLTSGTIMSVEVEDLTHGVASGTTYMTVNGAVPAGLVTTYSGVDPNRVIFAVPLEPLINFREDLTVVVHAENQFPGSYPVIKEEEYTLRPGYEVVWPNKTLDTVGGPEQTFSFVENVPVLVEAKNFARNYSAGAEFFRFLTENQPKSDLGAYLESSTKTADLGAALESINPFFEYGKTITVEIEAEDYEGHQLVFTHTFIIEPRPS